MNGGSGIRRIKPRPIERDRQIKLACSCAIICGALFLLSPALAQTGDPIPPKAYTMTPTGINIADGSFTFKVTDISIGTLSLDRFYTAGGEVVRDPDDMFYGWRSSNNFDIFVNPTFSKANSPYFPQQAKPIVHMGMDATGLYVQDQMTGTESISPDSVDAYRGLLALSNNAYVYTNSAGDIYTFNPSIQVSGVQGSGSYTPFSQRVASIQYHDGRLRTFSYVNGELKLVTDSSGYAILFDYIDYNDTQIGRTRHLIADACGFDLSKNYVTTSSTCASAGATLKVSYGYSGALLTSVTDVLNNTTNYQWIGTGLSCIKPPGSSTCQISNSYTDSRNLVQTLSDGSTWHVNFGGEELDSTDVPPENGNNYSIVTDPTGQTSQYTYTGTSPVSATDADGRTTTYVYTGGLDQETINPPPLNYGSTLVSEYEPGGDGYVINNSGPFEQPLSITRKAASGTGLSDQVTQYNYGALGGAVTYQNLAEPLAKIDPMGNETDYSYATWGGMLSEMAPAPTPNGARPLKLYTYVQKYSYIKNSSGSLVSSGAPIWMPATETDCQTAVGSSALACDTTAPQVLTTYQYGADGTADNLLLKGKVVTSGGVSLRTCYGYDQYSNKISETKPLAGLATCP